MLEMEGHYVEYVGLALFVASELIGMSKFKSNSLVQLVIAAAIKAFPYEPKRRNTGNPLDIFRDKR